MTAVTRKPAEERREEIVTAVLRIIGERGLTSLTAAAIAEEVGVTSGALFRHFDSLDAILREAVRHAVARIGETFPDASLPPLERLLQLARNRVRLLGADPGLAWLLRSEQAYLSLPEDAVQRLRELVERSKGYLLGAIREGAAAGSIRGDIEAEALLVLVMGAIHVLVGIPGVHRLAKGGNRQDPDRVLSALEKLLAPPVGNESKKPKRHNRRQDEYHCE